MDPVAPASKSGKSVIASSPSQGPSTASPPSSIIWRSLAAAWRHLDVEVADIRDLLGHAHEKGGRQRCAAHRGILDHDRDVDRVRYTPEKVADRAVSKLASEAAPSLAASPR